MFKFRKATPKPEPRIKVKDTGRISPRNIVNAKTEATRQAKFYRKGNQ